MPHRQDIHDDNDVPLHPRWMVPIALLLVTIYLVALRYL